jgi:hypothetical protein
MSETASNSCRIRFGVELALADGGRVRGEGFELRGCQEGISDRELAIQTMRHLRLAGVRGVRIVREHVTHGPPGRPTAAEADVGRLAQHDGDVEYPRIADG